MRILVLCYEYPPLGGGGGRVAKNIAEQMALRGHEVRVQTAALGWRSALERAAGLEVQRTASGRRAPDTCAVHEMGLYVVTSFLPALSQLRKWKPDVMHAHFAVPTGLLAWAAHRLTAVPYVLTAHLGDVPGGVPDQTERLFRLIDPIARQIWKRAAVVTAVSSFVQDLAERAYGRRPVRILNGIDLSQEPAPVSKTRPDRRLIFVGRFNPQKRPLFLIEALARLSAQNWTLTMIGDGPLMGGVRARIRELRLESRVTLTGWLDAAEVRSHLREADIFCIPSASEGLPVAAIEALQHGLAIVGSAIPGLADVVEEEINGSLAAVDDNAAYSRQLERLLTDEPILRAMQEASARKARDFDLAASAAVYEQVLSEAARRGE
jgi:glycosyltransferase involved in cell wall biosynthesis